MKREKGITLIALVITIIILLILAGVSLNLLIGEEGILGKTKDSVKATNKSFVEEQVYLAWTSAQTNYFEDRVKDASVVDSEYFEPDNLTKYLSEGEIVTVKYKMNEQMDSEVIYKDTKGKKPIYYTVIVEGSGRVVAKNEASTVAPIVIGESVQIGEDIITKANLGDYLGKEILYMPANPSTSYGTSKVYRLFYIDFEGKYGDGKGTIYLRADAGGSNIDYSRASCIYANGTSSDNFAIMKKLNPLWASASGNVSNHCEKVASWMMDPGNWEGWKDVETEGIKDEINYVVGAPSIEIYIDSYNVYLTRHPSTLDCRGEVARKLNYSIESGGYAIMLDDGTTSSFRGYRYLDVKYLMNTSCANGMYYKNSTDFLFRVSSLLVGVFSIIVFELSWF